MNVTVEIPHEFEAMALYLGTTPQKAAGIVLDWFSNPLRNTGLVAPRMIDDVNPSGSTAVVHYTGSQRLQRVDALDRMTATPPLKSTP